MKEPTLLVDGLGIPESPRWHDGRLWFCNWTTGQIVASNSLDPGGVVEVVATIATTVPYSIDWLLDGTLLVVSGQEAKLLAIDPAGSVSTYADLREHGEVFNEIVVDASGNAYVNGADIVLVGPDRSSEIVARGLRFGNGMAITPDGSTLIVAESHGRCLTGFTIGTEGRLSDRRVWADLDGDNPDGICIDADGAVWYASVPGRRCVCVREGGEVLDSVQIDRGAFACMLGGDDGRSLFIAAAEWRGMDGIGDGARTGQILVGQVDAPHAGRP